MKYAAEGDFVFLGTPYVPISEYSDFKRYTKDQFGEEDQRRLVADVQTLYERGCNIMMTNSNHHLVHELYNEFKIEVFKTKTTRFLTPLEQIFKNLLIRLKGQLQ